MTADIQEMEKGLQRNTIEWELNCSWEGYTYRDLRMHGVGDPVDVVNGIQPCPFVYLVKSTYNCYVDSLILLYKYTWVYII